MHQRPLILAANYKTTVAGAAEVAASAATVWLVRPPPCCINDHRKRFRNGKRVRWTVKCPITVFAREGRRDIVNDSEEKEGTVDTVRMTLACPRNNLILPSVENL